jgi:cyclohexyl-isocyanide hydratase
MSERLQIGILVFPRVTQLDFTGPLQVFSSVPGAEVHLIWKRIEPVRSDSVLTVTPTVTFADCPPLEVSRTGREAPTSSGSHCSAIPL